MTQDVGVRAERVRDLKSQIAGLGAQEIGEIVFQEISPGREPVTIYSVVDGEPIPVPAYMVEAVMGKTLDDGRFMFVAQKKNAPEYTLGSVKCFLHAESPERAILAEIGLAAASCPAAHLASPHSKRMHAQHRHKQEWAAFQEYVTAQKTAEYEARQQAQLDATLDIARAAGGQPAPSEPTSAPVEASHVAGHAACNNCGEAIEGKLANHQCK